MFYIQGHVQGVGYRYFAQRVARDLGVRGWARNLDDGRVEVYAMGTTHQLQDFEGELRVGPPHAEVKGVKSEEAGPPDIKIAGFHIR